MSNKALYDLTLRISANSAELNKGIKEANQKLDDFNKNAQRMDAIKGAFLKISGAIGTAVAAFKIYEKIMMSTEGTADRFEAQMGSIEGAIDGLFRTIATGDFGNLIDNMSRAAKATRDYKIALDELGDVEASNTVKRGYLERSLQSTRLAIAETTNPVDKSKYIQEAIEIQKAITALDVSEIQKRLNIKEDYFETLSGYDAKYYDYFVEQTRKIAGNYEYWFGQGSVAIEGVKARLDALNSKKTKYWNDLTDAQETERHNLQLTLFALQDFQNLQNTMKPDEFKEYVTTIGDLNAKIAEGDQELIKLTKSLTTVLGKLEQIQKTDPFPKANISQLKPDLASQGIPTYTGGLMGPGASISPEYIKSMQEINRLIQWNIENAPKMEETWQQVTTNIGSALSGLAGAFQSLGDVINQASSDGSLSFSDAMDIVVAAANTAIGILGALAAANLISKEIEKSGAYGVITAIAGIAALAAVWSSYVDDDKYAYGGIVGGNSYSGDRIPIRVNSGEMILNRDQQRSLFGSGGQQEQLISRVSGKDLEIILRRSR